MLFSSKSGYWNGIKAEKKKALEEYGLSNDSPKSDRLRAYIKYFPSTHPLQKHLSRALQQIIDKDSVDLSPESSNNGLQEAC